MSSSNLDKNLENIRRIDQFASKVIEHCTHAALFNFSIEQNKWLKTEVDGPLFIYERLDHPLYSMIVVNRQSPKNFVEPITDGLQLRYEPPYIFVHREDGCIRGLWVFGEDECKRVFDTLTKLSMELKMKSAGATTSSPKNSISNNNESGAVAAFAAATPPPSKIVAAAKLPTPPPSQQQQQQSIRVSSFISSNNSPFNNNSTKQYTNSNRGTTSSTNTGGGGADAMSTTISSSNTTTANIVGRDVAATTAATIAAVPAPVKDDNRNDSNNNNKNSNVVKPYINPNSAKSITTSSSCGRDVAATVATVATVKDDNNRRDNDSSSNIAMPTNTNTTGKSTSGSGGDRDVATVAELLEKIDVLQRQLDKANGNVEVLQRELDKANGRERLRAENEQLRQRVTELEADTHSLQAVARVLAELEANKHKQKQDGTNDTVAQ
ncbi:hypothetical protein niasHT_009603 [Heterodera trifolii]|uniref:Uncharacterized protein n=1 Tax=Heterodera trifolii TaxID=157864 RepID=A0ABD2LU32_9BILA